MVRPEGSVDRDRRGSLTSPTSAMSRARDPAQRNRSQEQRRRRALAAAAGHPLGGRTVSGTAQSAGARARAAWAAPRPADRCVCAAGLRASPRFLPGRRASNSSTPTAWCVSRPTESGREQLQTNPEAEVNWLAAEQSNSSLTVGDAVMLKIYRRILPGSTPRRRWAAISRRKDLPMRRRFSATSCALPPTAPPSRSPWRSVSSAIRATRGRGSWTSCSAPLTASPRRNPRGIPEADLLADCEAVIAAIGRRLGEMHAVLARETSEAAFAPEIAGAADAAQWGRQRREEDCHGV